MNTRADEMNLQEGSGGEVGDLEGREAVVLQEGRTDYFNRSSNRRGTDQ